MISVTYTNPSGGTITFSTEGTTDYGLTKIEGTENPSTDFQEQKSPMQSGSTHIATYYQPRDIPIEGIINKINDTLSSYTLKAQAQVILNSLLGDGTITYTNDYISKNITGSIKSDSWSFKSAVDPMLKYQLIFRCTYPFWRDLTISTETFGLVTPLLLFPVTFPTMFSSRSGSNTHTITNTGNIAAGMIITVVGPAINPVIINNTTTEFIKVNVTLAFAQQMTINTNFGQKTVQVFQGGVYNSGTQYLGSGSTFWQLAIGTNNITITDDSGFINGNMNMQWYNQYTGL